jgi:hypothetical protein
VNIGAAAIIQGFPGIHISLEARELDLAVKYAARFTGLDVNTIMAGPVDWLARVRNVLVGEKSLVIRYFPPRRLSLPELRAYLSFLTNSYDFKPRWIIIDLPDRMRMPDKKDTHEELGTLYDEIIGMLDDFRLTGWAASQIGREFYRVKDTKARGIKASWEKVANADNVFLMSQTEDERRSNIFRLFFAKTRFGRDGYERPFKIVYDKCFIADCSDQVTRILEGM